MRWRPFPAGSGVEGTTALAINSPTSGGAQVVVTANTVNNEPRGDLDTGVFVYNTSTQAATLLTSSSLGNLLVYDTWGNTPGEGACSRAMHQQRRAGSWLHRHPGQLMAHLDLGWHDHHRPEHHLRRAFCPRTSRSTALGHRQQRRHRRHLHRRQQHLPAVRDLQPCPEPSSVVLLVAGLVGLLVCAWRKQK